ncbi:MAG: hypothetical protein S4CHLAM7_14310 [Chlamydiae bacterium]|nr:hypothetical protein [Chlamydiota bacterium]
MQWRIAKKLESFPKIVYNGGIDLILIKLSLSKELEVFICNTSLILKY